MRTRRRSSRRVSRTSLRNARVRSVSLWRSWNSSMMTPPIPGNSGSRRSRCRRTPGVTISMRMWGEATFSPRIDRPTVVPTSSPMSEAMRRAAARAATLRGWVTRMRCPSGRREARRGGRRVVLPLPGGEVMTRVDPGVVARMTASAPETIGRSGSALVKVSSVIP